MTSAVDHSSELAERLAKEQHHRGQWSPKSNQGEFGHRYSRADRALWPDKRPGRASGLREKQAPRTADQGEAPDRDGYKQTVADWFAPFSDVQSITEDVVAEGDKVVVRMTWRGTHKGEFMGIPPTGKSVSFGVIDIVRFAGDKFAEHWGLMDSTSMMQQLGAVPAPGVAEG